MIVTHPESRWNSWWNELAAARLRRAFAVGPPLPYSAGMACPKATVAASSGGSPTASSARFAGWLAPLALLSGCGAPPPTTDDIRRAYAEHVAADRVHERGLQAKQAPVVIPQQEANCSRDGRTHFDCRIRVIFETAAGPRSEEQSVHVRREGGAWIIDSVN